MNQDIEAGEPLDPVQQGAADIWADAHDHWSELRLIYQTGQLPQEVVEDGRLARLYIWVLALSQRPWLTSALLEPVLQSAAWPFGQTFVHVLRAIYDHLYSGSSELPEQPPL
jgi:hypothetical protein